MAAPIDTLASHAEALIRRLRGVEGVSVRTDGSEIREIHVLTSSERPAKHIVRDVQSALRAELGVGIDHRVVSIAFANHGASPAAASAGPMPSSEPGHAEAGEPEPEADDRVRFENVNLFVTGPRTHAQVELRWKGLPRVGSASGWCTRDESHRLVAQASVTAVQEFLADPVAFSVQGVELVDVGRRRVAVVAVSMLAHRQEKVLTGSCSIDQDTPQAVALATLAALNRVVAGMRAKEPTEYVLRPESFTQGG